MKIVHLCTYNHGGAFIAANELSKKLGGIVVTRSYNRRTYFLWLVGFVSSRFLDILFLKGERFYWSFNCPRYMVPNVIKSADILHIHWTSEWIILNKNLKGPDLFYHYHDMSKLTGGCYYADKCSQFFDSCTSCPKSRYPFKRYIQKIAMLNIQELRSEGRVHVSPSNWMKNLVDVKLGTHRSYRVPNIHPTLKLSNRAVTKGGVSLLLGSASNIYDERKNIINGIDFALAAGFHVLVMGDYSGLNGKDYSRYVNRGVEFLGYLNSRESVFKAFESVDLFLLPSLEENYSNMLAEALSRGVPVVALDIGGNSDLVIQGKTGYLISNLVELSLVFKNESESKLRDNIEFKNYLTDNFKNDESVKTYYDKLYNSHQKQRQVSK